MSIFADDKHCFWELSSYRDFKKAVDDIKVVVSVITSLGMQINFQKSLPAIAVKGTKALELRKRYFKQWNGRQSLAIRMDAHDIYIPIWHRHAIPWSNSELPQYGICYSATSLQTGKQQLCAAPLGPAHKERTIKGQKASAVSGVCLVVYAVC